jgi:hypothetical protein
MCLHSCKMGQDPLSGGHGSAKNPAAGKNVASQGVGVASTDSNVLPAKWGWRYGTVLRRLLSSFDLRLTLTRTLNLALTLTLVLTP